MRVSTFLVLGLLLLTLSSACSTGTRVVSNQPGQPNAHSNEKTITGKVVGIADGDTITVYDGTTSYKIRLAGIDAPESHQAFGQRSKGNLSDLIFGKTVSVSTNKTDRYGRTVGVVYFNGDDINLKQVLAGFAWHYKQFASEQSKEDQVAYAAAEQRARDLQLGLWADQNPVPPWDDRARRRNAPSKESSDIH